MSATRVWVATLENILYGFNFLDPSLNLSSLFPCFPVSPASRPVQRGWFGPASTLVFAFVVCTVCRHTYLSFTRDVRGRGNGEPLEWLGGMAFRNGILALFLIALPIPISWCRLFDLDLVLESRTELVSRWLQSLLLDCQQPSNKTIQSVCASARLNSGFDNICLFPASDFCWSLKSALRGLWREIRSIAKKALAIF